MSATDAPRRSPEALESILSRASALTLKEPAPSPEDLRSILLAATRAPDHGKLQPWRFTVLEGAAREQLGDLMVASMRARDPQAGEADLERERKKIYRAPTIVVAGAKVVEHKIPAFEQIVAVAAAVENMILAAHALGYGTMWKTGEPAYDESVKAYFGLGPADAILGFVYLGTIDAMPKAFRETRYEEVVTHV